MKKLRKDRLLKISLMTLFAVFFVYVISNISSLQEKLKVLKAEQEMLEETKQETIIKTEQAQRMIEYSKSDQYIEQYARERLGWVKEGEIKFVDIDDPNGSPFGKKSATLTEQEILPDVKAPVNETGVAITSVIQSAEPILTSPSPENTQEAQAP